MKTAHIEIPFIRLRFGVALKPSLVDEVGRETAKLFAVYLRVRGRRPYVAVHALWFVVGGGWL